MNTMNIFYLTGPIFLVYAISANVVKGSLLDLRVENFKKYGIFRIKDFLLKKNRLVPPTHYTARITREGENNKVDTSDRILIFW
jgi:hypothetical protein